MEKKKQQQQQQNEIKKDEEMESEESDSDDSEEDQKKTKLNGKVATSEKKKESELITKCKDQLEMQMKEIKNVFANGTRISNLKLTLGMDKAALTKAKDWLPELLQ